MRAFWRAVWGVGRVAAAARLADLELSTGKNLLLLLLGAAPRLMSVTAWVEHIWTRLRRLDYWAPGMIATNASMKQYRPRTPGGQPLPNIPKAGDEKYYDIRYFPNDHRRRDVGYYPDTPLSLTHNIMKNTPLSKNHGLRPYNDAPSQIPEVGAFAALTGGLSYSEELRRKGAFDDDGTGQRPIDARDLQGKPMQNF